MSQSVPEILAPAGSPEALLAAVAAGADAVYLGGSGFNARRGAKNFDSAALFQALAYCRKHEVKTHLTFNTLAFDRELPALARALYEAAQAGADAFILQDLAAVRLAREVAPEVQRHGSTQMSVHTLSGALQLYEMGFSRVVLARELAGRQIQEIVNGLRDRSVPLETEMFVHGAHCMCVSGQCYLSAFLGGRSGNRGLCAQPCRLPFSLTGEPNFTREKTASNRAASSSLSDHALSLKDLSLLPQLPQLAALGVDSLKIEGRMKRPEYVYAAVRAACKAREGTFSSKDMEELAKIFSRGGFTDGFFQNNTGFHMFGIRQRENQDAKSQELLSRIRSHYPTAFPVEKDAPSSDLSSGQILCPDPEQLSLSAPHQSRRGRPMALWARFASLEQLPQEAVKLARRVVLPLDTDWGRLASVGLSPDSVLAELPRWVQQEALLLPLLEKVRCAGLAGVMVQNIGQISLCRRAGVMPVGGFGMNLTNSLAAKEWKDLGVSAFTASIEMNLPKLRALPSDLTIGMVAYGHLPLMLLRCCPQRAKGGCKRCQSGNPVFLRDRKGARFPLQCSGLQKKVAPELLNPLPLCLWDKKKELDCADFLLLHFTIESKKDCGALLTAYLYPEKASPPKEGAFTRGLCFKPID